MKLPRWIGALPATAIGVLVGCTRMTNSPQPAVVMVAGNPAVSASRSSTPAGDQLTVAVTYVNLESTPLFVARCGGQAMVQVEALRSHQWRPARTYECPLILRPAWPLASGDTLRETVVVRGDRESHDVGFRDTMRVSLLLYRDPEASRYARRDTSLLLASSLRQSALFSVP